MLLFLLSISANAQRQQGKEIYNPNYDERPIRYGFLLGLTSTGLDVKYANRFITEQFDTVTAIQAPYSAGLAIGFIGQLRIADYLDLRLTPTVVISEYDLVFSYTDQEDVTATAETVFVDLPLLLKYKSARRGNNRLYVIFGIKPGFEISGRQEDQGNEVRLPLGSTNLAVDFGFGLDAYYPLFKFSPEIRFSKGLTNLRKPSNQGFEQGIQRVTTNTISLLLHFQ